MVIEPEVELSVTSLVQQVSAEINRQTEEALLKLLGVDNVADGKKKLEELEEIGFRLVMERNQNPTTFIEDSFDPLSSKRFLIEETVRFRLVRLSKTEKNPGE